MRHFQNPGLEFMAPAERNGMLLAWSRHQLAYARAHVPRFARYDVRPEHLTRLQDCLRLVPRMDKGDLKNVETPYELVPVPQRHRIRHAYSTSGTTGRPAAMLFTQNDWQAATDGFIRSMPELHGVEGLRVFNGCRRDHISGNIFNDGLRQLGALPVTRKYGVTDEQALDEMVRFQCNVLMAPWQATGKGGSLEDLLEEDARRVHPYLTGKHLLALLCSSVPISDGLAEELQQLGIRYVYNNYGTTEGCQLAASCQVDLLRMHLMPGPQLLEVVDEEGSPVPSGGTGRVVISRIAGYDDAGRNSINEGTQLLNYEVGDEAQVLREPCPCGRTTPRIHHVRRVRYVQEKVESGCQNL